MNLTTFEWSIISIIGGAAIGIIGYFLKRTMHKTDEHGVNIQNIQLTYVTKDEMKELKKEMRTETQKVSEDVSEIKENYLKKDDFLRSQVETNKKLDRIYELLLNERRGANGKE